MPKNYLVLDFETTGLDYKKEQVTEIGAIKYDEKFNEIASFHTYVKLHVEHGLSDFIKDYTGITEEMLVNGMDEDQAMKAISYMIDSETIVVAQYAPFDFAYLSKYHVYPSKYICTKTLTDIYEPHEKSGLGVTCERNGIVLENAHTAMGDVEATTELLRLRLRQGMGSYANCITEQADRPHAFIPFFTSSVLNKDDFK